ncbi:MAG: hypothetical protein GY716_12760 [bacterium]|nr:hypothetical protein [bacterium]
MAVVRCQTHDCRFTLYPSGFAPYRRQPVLRMGPDGEPTPGDSGRDEFADTLFEAAIDARVGRAWARDTVDEDDPPDRWWGTQGRHLALAARLVGIAKDLADSVRERIAAALQVGTLVLREHSAARGFRAIGAAVCDVFGRLRARSRRAEQLLLCGHLTEHWGEPWRWDATRRRMERSPFLCKGTAVGSSP